MNFQPFKPSSNQIDESGEHCEALSKKAIEGFAQQTQNNTGNAHIILNYSSVSDKYRCPRLGTVYEERRKQHIKGNTGSILSTLNSTVWSFSNSICGFRFDTYSDSVSVNIQATLTFSMGSVVKAIGNAKVYHGRVQRCQGKFYHRIIKYRTRFEPSQVAIRNPQSQQTTIMTVNIDGKLWILLLQHIEITISTACRETFGLMIQHFYLLEVLQLQLVTEMSLQKHTRNVSPPIRIAGITSNWPMRKQIKGKATLHSILCNKYSDFCSISLFDHGGAR